jgi:hypothetical protein
MPRYHFHVCDGQDFVDLHGTELPDLAAAKREAARYAAHLLQDQPETFWDSAHWHMRVTDDQNMTLFDLTFIGGDAAAIARSERPPK